MHRTSERFRECFRRLPDHVRARALKKFELLKSNPRHPSLRFKKVGLFWSVRIDSSYRALAIEDGKDFLWFWIGIHADYDSFI